MIYRRIGSRPLSLTYTHPTQPPTHSEGYSLWFCEYQYNEELSKLFMTCNLVSGFVQRTDELRKWAFGVMWITGEDAPGKQKITGCWLMRGHSDEYIKSANPDAEYYNWTKVATPVSDADKAKIKEWWCSETTVGGLPVLDCKVRCVACLSLALMMGMDLPARPTTDDLTTNRSPTDTHPSQVFK